MRPVHGRAVVHVVRPRQEHRPDAGRGEAPQLGRDALHGPARLRVRVEQVTRDQEQVHVPVQGGLHRPRERGELALALSGRALPEVGVTGPEVHVGGMQDAQHPGSATLRCGRVSDAPRFGGGASEEPPWTSPARPSVGRQCDT